jgi:protocatechuate 4,5-dioxygenase, alpha chain
MARREQAYDDIPGTFVFDAERAREGYPINSFCMSLMKDENRKAFKADEAGYIKQFHMTPDQEKAVLTRDYNRMLELGANIYFTAKLGATDGHSFQHLAAVMTGNTQQAYADMMLKGGRNVDGNRSTTGANKPVSLSDDKFATGVPKRAAKVMKKIKVKAKLALKATGKGLQKAKSKVSSKSKSSKKRK